MKVLVKVCLMLVVAGTIVACTTSPTGRSQLNLFSGSALNSLGAESFAEIKQQEKVSTDRELNAYAQCLADAIIEVLPEEYQGREWEVAVFESDTINAFALPGGYMGFYTGIMRLAENEHQLAAVMGHEIGHVLADHSSERLSTNLLLSGIMVGADIALTDRPPQQRGMIMAGLGLGAQVGVMLPYSRTHESEADEIGLDLMARAGFDPHEAPKLWENMAKISQGAPPELLSTHPSPQTRIRNLSRQIPEVMPLYEARLASAGPANCPRPRSLDQN
ncbi:M48 family metallopeptidase [Aliidiomarina halalkaliphila]|uniref:M48 family metallopeptidase n=1 Tax=Aliidiomarina halalkaliphila TaxID=2593535 RepID=A0A552X2X1_9GAMM|nr:M48 family metallopeptidase [Aliidiomarina halalkaliphila]TRW49381.1 M48 family metallopeptidase [Aliidiomarina halalkaliphila]